MTITEYTIFRRENGILRWSASGDTETGCTADYGKDTERVYAEIEKSLAQDDADGVIVLSDGTELVWYAERDIDV